VKLIDLERHLRFHKCVPYREGGSHSIWLNPATGKIASVPRHREIKQGTISSICRQLEIPEP